MDLNYLIGELTVHRLNNRNLEDYDWSGNDMVRIAIEEYVSKYQWDKGIGLVGWMGVGKTHLLVSLYKERMWKAVYHNSQLPVWITFLELVELWQTDKSIVSDVLNRGEIIFIDDLFCTGYTMKETSIIRDIVYKCYDDNKVLCFTSNVLLSNWDIDDRAKDRLKEMVLILEVVGESRRR